MRLQVGIFLNVMEFRNLTGTKGSSSEHLQTPHQLPSGQAQDLFDVDWWIPTLDFSDHSISLGLDDIWTYLQVYFVLASGWPMDMLLAYGARLSRLKQGQMLHSDSS